MAITNQLFIEAKKHKDRHNLLIFFGVILIEVLFLYGNYKSEKGLSNGWMIIFYNTPLINSLFFPILLSAFASRLMDIEHKGDMLKCLYTFTSPNKIFFVKAVYGLMEICVLVILQCISMIIMMKMLDFPLNFSAKYMLFYGINNFISCSMLFLIHLILAYFSKNQALSISVGLIGSFLGLFSAYLPPSVFQKLLPWSTFTNSLFIGMDWNPETRVIKWILLDLKFDSALYSILCIAISILVSLLLLKKSGLEEQEFKKKTVHANTKIHIHKCPIEFIKLKGSPSWFAFFIIPVISAIIGTANYLANIEILKNGWYSLWTQHTLFLAYFFMPVIIAVFAGCIWRVDHFGTNMNLLLTHTSPVKIILSKYAVSIFITILSLIWITALYIFSGIFSHVHGSFPNRLPLWLLYGIIGACSVCAVQIFLSLVIRNFVLPIIIAFIGGILGLVCTAQNIPYTLPYSLFSLAMTENNININIPLFLISSVIFIVLFLILSIFYLRFSDVKSHE